MVDLKLQVPATDKFEVNAETLTEIDRGIKDADEGRTVPIDEVRKMIPKWISKFESQRPPSGFRFEPPRRARRWPAVRRKASRT